jgi:hypothetical protein
MQHLNDLSEIVCQVLPFIQALYFILATIYVSIQIYHKLENPSLFQQFILRIKLMLDSEKTKQPQASENVSDLEPDNEDTRQLDIQALTFQWGDSYNSGQWWYSPTINEP